MDSNLLQLVEVVANIAILPLCAILWNMQGRLSKIEGSLASREFHRRKSTHTEED